MRIRHCVWCVVSLVAISSFGCRMSAPIHVWQPAQLNSTVGKRVAVSKVAGPEAFSDPVEQRLISAAPQDPGRTSMFVNAERLKQRSPIRLVSAGEETFSDVALAAVARRAGFDFMLHGRVVDVDEQDAPDEVDDLADSSRTETAAGSDAVSAPQRMTLSWRLTQLEGEQRPWGSPIVVDLDAAITRYPDLALVTDPKTALVEAAVRDTHRLLAPSVAVDRATLAIPYLLPGSGKVRRGNAMARVGNWSEARRFWNEATEDYPWQNASLINLAIAHVAAQEFSQARDAARRAVRRFPSKLARQTLVWVELMQRDYHKAFELPDPPEGWFVTRRPEPAESGSGRSR